MKKIYFLKNYVNSNTEDERIGCFLDKDVDIDSVIALNERTEFMYEVVFAIDSSMVTSSGEVPTYTVKSAFKLPNTELFGGENV